MRESVKEKASESRRKSSNSRHDGQAILALGVKQIFTIGSMELKDWVKAARQHKDMTLEQLAHAVGRSKAAAGFWETGKTKPSFAQMQQISGITGYPMPGDAASSATSTTDQLAAPRSKRWPYERIDYEKLVSLKGAAAKNLENAILAAAADIDIDIKAARFGKRKAA